ncbi:MAG: flagellar hook-basal body complex protein FliE [Candidatus Lokiarchaeota archaeon]|nr:flagellar hook-basal body complex protein FliE [Candidatus Lokiarchaeota archaeon]
MIFYSLIKGYGIKLLNRNFIIIGFCGLPGSGKSTAIEAINDWGVVINMGDIVREEAKKSNISETDENLGKIAQNLRQVEGKGVLAKKCVEKIQKSNNSTFFIDGLRSWEEVEMFRKYWKFPVIAIKTDLEKRFQIIKKRDRKDDPDTLKELRKRENRELNFGLDKVIKNADYEIMNNSTKKVLKKKTREIVKKIINENGANSF